VRIVMDTNVVLAGLVNPNGLAALLILALDGEVLENYTSDEGLEELILKIGLLAEEGKLSSEWKKVLSHFVANSKVVSPSRKFNLSRDPDDNKWLEIAYEVKAACILTWDQDLLDLRDENRVLRLDDHSVEVLTPSEFYHSVIKALC